MDNPAGRFDGLTLVVPLMSLEHAGHQLDVLVGGTAVRDVLIQERAAIAKAQKEGMKIIEVPTEDLGAISSYLEDPSTLLYEGYATITSDKEKAFFDNEGKDIPRPWQMSYEEYSRGSTRTFPIVLSLKAHGGQSKYLVESLEQLAIFEGFAEYLQGEYNVGSRYDVKEYIETPSQHYTSYRIVLNPFGDPIAAGLLYSEHIQEERVVEIPREENWNTLGASYSDILENPDSPFFLGSKDIRSNVNQGGTVIPLMGGEYARVPTSLEQEILAEHGIDPKNIKLPEQLEKYAKRIGKNLGRYYGMGVGLDFIQDKDSGVFYFLESNPGPGGQTVIECWQGSNPGETLASQQASVLDLVYNSLENRQSHKRFRMPGS